MYKNKLLDYLSRLDAGEMKRFLRFLRSPYHSTNKPVLALVNYLSAYHPDFAHTNLKKATLFKKVYGANKTFNESRLDQVMTQAVRLFEQFVTVEEALTHPVNIGESRLKAFRQKRMDKAFFKAVEKQETVIEALALIEGRSRASFRLNKIVFNHPATTRHLPEMPSLDAVLHHLDDSYIWEKLEWMCVAKNRELILPKQYAIQLESEILQQLSRNEVYKSSAQLYIKLLASFKDLSIENMQALIHIYELHLPKIPTSNRVYFYSLISNLMAIGIRRGLKNLSALSLRLYKIALENALFEEAISPVKFTNIVVVSCVEKEFEWVDEFIEQYKERIHKKERKNCLLYSLAYINYYKGLATKNKELFYLAIDYLNQVDLNLPFYNYRVRQLLLKSYYETMLPEFRAQEFMVDNTLAFERYLQRDVKLNDSKKQDFMNLCKTIRSLAKVKARTIKDPKSYLDKLETKVLTYEMLSSRDWLLEKIREQQSAP